MSSASSEAGAPLRIPSSFQTDAIESPATIDEQFAYVVPNGTKEIMISARLDDFTAPLPIIKLSHENGFTNNYRKINGGVQWSSGNIYARDVIIYMKCSRANAVIEIELKI